MLVRYQGERLTHSKDGTYDVMCMPPTDDLDWSKDLFDGDGTPKSPELVQALASFLAVRGVTDVFAPSIGYRSGAIVYPHQLSDQIRLSDAVCLHRNREVPADGLLIKKKQAFMMANGGCPIIVADAQGIVIVAHAARDSLLDRAFITTGERSREHMSVVNAIQSAFRHMHIHQRHVSLAVFFGIPVLPFTHPVNDPAANGYNRKMVDHVLREWGSGIIVDPQGKAHLSISHLIKAQATTIGFKDVLLRHPLPEDGEFAYTRHDDENLCKKRNLILVWRS